MGRMRRFFSSRTKFLTWARGRECWDSNLHGPRASADQPSHRSAPFRPVFIHGSEHGTVPPLVGRLSVQCPPLVGRSLSSVHHCRSHPSPSPPPRDKGCSRDNLCQDNRADQAVANRRPWSVVTLRVVAIVTRRRSCWPLATDGRARTTRTRPVASCPVGCSAAAYRTHETGA